MEIARHDALRPYVTRDGSEIREWVAPGTPGRRQSLAEATVPPYSHEDTVLAD